MFPKSSGANIGLGFQRSFSKGRTLNQYTDDFISNMKEILHSMEQVLFQCLEQ